MEKIIVLIAFFLSVTNCYALDNVYKWHTFYGANGSDSGHAIAIDSKGNVYVVGTSNESWLGENNTSPIHAHSGRDDITIVKLNPDGVYQWHTFYGSSESDHGISISIDTNDNIYVVGYSDFNWLGDGNINPIHPLGEAGMDVPDITVLKLDKNGIYQWHTFYGSDEAIDYGRGISVDTDGSVYVTGSSLRTWQGDGNIDPIHNTITSGGIAIFKLDKNGTYQWHTFYGWGCEGFGITVGADSNVYIVGSSWITWKGDNNTPPLHTHGLSSDITVIKLNTDGDYQWHTFYGGDCGYDIALDKNGNLYVAGSSVATWQGDGDISPLNAYTGNNDITILKLTTSGTYLWHTFYGTEHYDVGYAIAIDKNNEIYVAGRSNETWKGDGDTEPFHQGSTLGNNSTILKLTTNGIYQWHTFYGPNRPSNSTDIAIDENDNVYSVDSTSYSPWEADGNTTPIHIGSGSYDISILKLHGYDDTLKITTSGSGQGKVISNPIGINCGYDCFDAYENNKTIMLTAIPGTDSKFIGWSGDCDQDGNVIINADKSCTAIFQNCFSWPMFFPAITGAKEIRQEKSKKAEKNSIE
ncbi:MAG TPA: hypothetical protein ENK96_07115 [Desulfobulbaceae bacterium]|nr:hypothetical protein [Desulfobulbaceae bacterium]